MMMAGRHTRKCGYYLCLSGGEGNYTTMKITIINADYFDISKWMRITARA